MSTRISLALLLMISFVFLGYVSLIKFHNYSNSADEHCYLYQAQLFAKGHISQSLANEEYPLRSNYMVIQDGKLYTKYPPGFSLLLSLGVLAGCPWLINPFLSVITLFFIFKLAETFVKPWIALCAVLLIASNSYFIGYGASYFSQPAALMFVTMGFYFYRKYELFPGATLAFISGLLIGYCFLVRQMDAFCLFLVLGSGVVLLAVKTNRKRDILYFMIGPLMGVLLLIAYTFILTGVKSISIESPLRDETYFYHAHITGFWANMELFIVDYFNVLKQSFSINLLHGFMPKIGFPFMVLTLAGLIKPRSSFIIRCSIFVMIFILLYNFHYVDQWSQYGTRYWYPLVGVMSVLAACGLNVINDRFRRNITAGLLILSLVIQIIIIGHDLGNYSRRFQFIDSVYKDIHEYCPENAVVILKKPQQWKGVPEYVFWQQFHNNFMPQEPRLFVYDQRQADALLWLYPHRMECLYNFSNVLTHTSE